MIITGFIKPRSPELISIQKQLKGLFTGALLRAAQHDANPAMALPTTNNDVELAMHGLIKAASLTNQGELIS